MPRKTSGVQAVDRPIKKYRLRGRECVSMGHFYREAERAFKIPEEGSFELIQYLFIAL